MWLEKPLEGHPNVQMAPESLSAGYDMLSRAAAELENVI